MPRFGRIKNLGRASLGARQKDLPAPDLHTILENRTSIEFHFTNACDLISQYDERLLVQGYSVYNRLSLPPRRPQTSLI